ncbi:MAG: hypothetical protein ACRD1S_00940 [Vicinamibacterales bacterium]
MTDRRRTFLSATRMQIASDAAGLVVRCPGCCAEQIIPRGTAEAVFEHSDEGCPVYREIQAALEAFRETTEPHA